MAFKRSAVRSRLSPPERTTKSTDFVVFSFAGEKLSTYPPMLAGIFRFVKGTGFYVLAVCTDVLKGKQPKISSARFEK